MRREVQFFGYVFSSQMQAHVFALASEVTFGHVIDFFLASEVNRITLVSIILL